jgi:hypothetical protein
MTALLMSRVSLPVSARWLVLAALIAAVVLLAISLALGVPAAHAASSTPE